MSYCVNCGVELDSSAKKCALCDTPVYHPLKPVEKNSFPPFSDETKIPVNMKRKLVALIATYILLIPNIVCLLINLFTSSEKLWFIFVGSTSLLLWVVFIFPFLVKKLYPYLMWAFDTVAAALYIFVFYSQNFGGGKWYFFIALPITLIVSACVFIFIVWDKKRKHHWTSKILHIFIDIVISFAVASVCFVLNDRKLAFEISLIVSVCSLALVFFWLYLNKSRKARAWLEKKVFV